MPRTSFPFAAYNRTMEQILARLIFSAIEKDPKAKQTVCNLLQFYRDNRELIALFLNAQSLGANAQTQAPPPPPPEQEKSRPQDTVGSKNILEEYLKRAM